MRFAVAAALAIALAAVPAGAETLRVGRSPGYLFLYTPLDVGISKGFFAKRDLTIDRVDFEGAAKMDQGIVAGAVDVTLGSPMEMAYAVKGLPAIGIAVIAQPMSEFSLLVPWDSPAHSFDDLKGKTIGIATVGSITQWVALELARVKGWGPDGIKTVGIGAGNQTAAAALQRHLVDASVNSTTLGIILAREQKARSLGDASQFVTHFIAHEMFATNAMVRDRPDAVRRFIAGWRDAVVFMRANKAETVAIVRPVTGLGAADEDEEYDRQMPAISATGRFDPADIARIGQSFVELHLLDREPDMSKLYTEQFLAGG
jgi:NitT/TauT family transport system substrate-binding protein